MSFILSLFFVAFAVLSTFVQASDHALKKWISPGLTVYCGLILLYGAVAGNVPLGQGLTMFIALWLLAASDFMFERSVVRPEIFPLAMVFGVVSGFVIGILFNVVASLAGVPVLVQAGCAVVGIIMAVLVYRYLEVEPALRLAVYVYLVQAVILLAGGLACLFAGEYPFAVWGILLFVSDSLVGIRAFPNPQRRIGWLSTYRILLAILVIYYAAQFAMVWWAG
jgi:hypothetical protein